MLLEQKARYAEMKNPSTPRAAPLRSLVLIPVKSKTRRTKQTNFALIEATKSAKYVFLLLIDMQTMYEFIKAITYSQMVYLSS